MTTKEQIQEDLDEALFKLQDINSSISSAKLKAARSHLGYALIVMMK